MTEGTITDSQLLALSLVAVWSLIWKGFALWRAAMNKDKVWFIVLLFLNTLGILEILYLFVFSKREKAAKSS